MNRTKVVIMGAAGRDFHDFNVVYREDPSTEVVAFTATQIPDIDDAGTRRSWRARIYPEGIPIVPEEELEELIRDEDVDPVIFSYSDVPHENVMHVASRARPPGRTSSSSDRRA